MPIVYDQKPKESFPTYESTFYVFEIIGMKDNPDNSYEGESKPCVNLFLQPVKRLDGGDMVDEKGESIENSYEKDGETHQKYGFFSVNYWLDDKGMKCFSTDDRSKMYQLTKAVFPKFPEERPLYTEIEHFKGDKVVGQFMPNKTVKGLANFKENKIKTQEEIDKIELMLPF